MAVSSRDRTSCRAAVSASTLPTAGSPPSGSPIRRLPACVLVKHPETLDDAPLATVWSDGLVPNNTPDSDVDAVAAQARDKLVAAAEECIDRGEIGRATVGALAESAGIHRVTFYRHFPDKESLVIEVLQRRAAPVLERAAQTYQAGDFFTDGLIEGMATAISEVRTTPGLMAALGLYPTDDALHSAGTSDRFLRSAIEITGPHLAEAQSAGLLRSDIPVDDIVEWLMQVCLANLLLKPEGSIEETRLQLIRFVVPAIRAS